MWRNTPRKLIGIRREVWICVRMCLWLGVEEKMFSIYPFFSGFRENIVEFWVVGMEKNY